MGCLDFQTLVEGENCSEELLMVLVMKIGGFPFGFARDSRYITYLNITAVL